MNKMQHSDEITKLATVPQAMERYKISRNTLMKYAEQYNALVKFGKSVRIDIEKFDAGIEYKQTAEIITANDGTKWMKI